MEDLVLSDKSLDLTIEGFSWSGNSVANELDFVTQVIKDAAADNTSVLIWQPVDRNASAPAAVLAVNAGLKLLWVDEFVVGYQNNGIGTQTTSIPQPHDAPVSRRNDFSPLRVLFSFIRAGSQAQWYACWETILRNYEGWR